MSNLDEELAAAKAELEALEHAEEERAAATAKERELAAVRREVADRKAIDKAAEEHGEGKFALIRTDLGVVIVKRPNHMHYRRFINLKDPSSDDATRLVVQCLVHPDKAGFEALSEELPGVPMLAASAVIDLAAGRTKDLSGKS